MNKTLLFTSNCSIFAKHSSENSQLCLTDYQGFSSNHSTDPCSSSILSVARRSRLSSPHQSFIWDRIQFCIKKKYSEENCRKPLGTYAGRKIYESVRRELFHLNKTHKHLTFQSRVIMWGKLNFHPDLIKCCVRHPVSDFVRVLRPFSSRPMAPMMLGHTL